MSLHKAIEHGKEHRKPWSGKANSKNFDSTCCNHGSCEYCKNNRLHKFRIDLTAANERLKEWNDMNYYVTYLLLFENGETKEYVENFAYYPTQHDMNEVGNELLTDYNATNFCASRGRCGLNGWEDDD